MFYLLLLLLCIGIIVFCIILYYYFVQVWIRNSNILWIDWKFLYNSWICFICCDNHTNQVNDLHRYSKTYNIYSKEEDRLIYNSLLSLVESGLHLEEQHTPLHHTPRGQRVKHCTLLHTTHPQDHLYFSANQAALASPGYHRPRGRKYLPETHLCEL